MLCYCAWVKIVIVGGCGHVGLPLGVALATQDLDVIALDIDPYIVSQVNSGETPFFEKELTDCLRMAIKKGFQATLDPNVINFADIVIIVIGTPLNNDDLPDKSVVKNVIQDLSPNLSDGQLLILRSTVYPGCTKDIEKMLSSLMKKNEVVFCPERIAEGVAMTELHSLPQIVGARSDEAFKRASELFVRLGVEVIRTSPEEAELAKLFSNSWRYIKFATANEFWMIAQELGINFENVRHAVTYNYPRASDLPKAGFASGPCLFKDTKQLSVAWDTKFRLGNSAIEINQGLPEFVVTKLKDKYNLKILTVGILGMAFKGESDDSRSSLSYNLKSILESESKKVLTHDPYVLRDTSLVSLEVLLEEADIFLIGAPHNLYSNIDYKKPLIDIWNLTKRGSSI